MAVPVPAALVAESVAVYVPALVGVPETVPPAVSMPRPGGRPVAA